MIGGKIYQVIVRHRRAMKLQRAFTINGRMYPAGTEISWYKICPFFLFHMLVFGGIGFYLAYFDQHTDLSSLYWEGGFGVTIYTGFYLFIFGRDEVKWMFINAFLGLLGIYSQIGWFLSIFGKKISDYPLQAHVFPFLYYVLYTFLLRHMVMDITKAREDPAKKKRVERYYITISVAVYLISYYFLIQK